MRTLSEIVEGAKDGNMPTHEECYWAMLALDALLQFDQRALMDLATKRSKILTPDFQWKEAFNRAKRALERDPHSWVGWSNDPANPDYQRMRKVALKLADKAMKGELKPPTSSGSE